MKREIKSCKRKSPRTKKIPCAGIFFCQELHFFDLVLNDNEISQPTSAI